MLTTPNFRFSPHEWANPHPCIDTGFVVQNDFTLANRWEDHVHNRHHQFIIVQDDEYHPERFHTCTCTWFLPLFLKILTEMEVAPKTPKIKNGYGRDGNPFMGCHHTP